MPFGHAALRAFFLRDLLCTLVQSRVFALPRCLCLCMLYVETCPSGMRPFRRSTFYNTASTLPSVVKSLGIATWSLCLTAVGRDMLFDHAALRALFLFKTCRSRHALRACGPSGAFLFKTSSMWLCLAWSLRIATLSLSLDAVGRDMPFGHAALRAFFFSRHLLCDLVQSRVFALHACLCVLML